MTRSSKALLATSLMALLLAAGPTLAQKAAPAKPIHQLSIAEQIVHAKKVMPLIDAALIRNPNNLNALYAKAQASLALGQSDIARNAYVRLVQLAPQNPRLRMELAKLDMDNRRWKEAYEGLSLIVKRPDLPAALRPAIERAHAFAAENLTPHKLSGSLTFGFRAETNANNGPDSNLIEIWGLPFVLSGDALPQSDMTASVTGRLNYSYRLNDHGDVLGASLLAYAMRPSKVDGNRREGIELRFGPSINLKRFGIKGGVFAQGVVGSTRAGGEKQHETVGVTFGAVLTPDAKNRFQIAYNYRDEDHTVSKLRKSADQRDNKRNELSFGWSHLLRPDLMINAGLSLENRNATAAWNSLRGSTFSLGATKQYSSPVAWSEGAWSTGVRVLTIRRTHDAPDMLFSATNAQTVRMTQFDLDHRMPLKNGFVANIGLSAARSKSNYDTSNWSDKSINLSITYAF